MKRLLRFCCIRRLGLVLLALLGLLPWAQAQAPPPTAYLRPFGPSEGFRPAFVYVLLQDRQGYLWLGTGEGLVRYDGARFVTFTHKDGLAEDFVVSLCEEPATGRLWVGHYQGGISVKKTANGPFSTAGRAAVPAGLRLPANGPPPVDTAAIGRYLRRYHLRPLAGTEISCLLEDRDGNAWLGTAGQGLLRHSDRHLWLKPYSGPPQRNFPALATVRTGADSDAWLTSSGNLFYQLRADYGGARRNDDARLPPLPGTVKALLPRPARLGGGFWVGTSAGLYATKAPGQPARPVPGLSGQPAFEVTALAYAPGSGLWVGTAAAGIYLLPVDSSRRVRHFTTANGLLHNTTYALLADRAGRVWAATHGTGIVAYEPVRDAFVPYRLGSVGLDASSLAEDADGRIWVGTEGQGLYCRQLSGQWQQLTTAGRRPADYTYGLLPLPAVPGQPGPQLLLVHRQGLSLLDCRTHTFTELAATDNPLVRDCLGPAALAAVPGAGAVAWLSTRSGLLRVDVDVAVARRRQAARPPGPALTSANVDGEPRPLAALGTLPATRHRVSFAYQGIRAVPKLLYRI